MIAESASICEQGCVHDLHIDGIRVENGCRLILSLSKPDGEHRYELSFDHVLQLAIDGFGMQNIIFDMSVFAERETSFEFLRACALLDLDAAKLQELNAGWCLVFVQASVGAEIACLMDRPWQPSIHGLDNTQAEGIHDPPEPRIAAALPATSKRAP